MNEEWRPVPGFEHIYAVSSLGRVKRIARSPRGQSPKVLTPTLHNKGYLRVFLCPGNRTVKTLYVHRLVASAFLGPPPENCEVNHLDGDKTNNTPANLEYISHLENVRHAVKIGLAAKPGEKSHKSKLTEEQARFILANKGKLTQESMARKFGVARSTVAFIQLGRNWKHLQRATAKAS